MAQDASFRKYPSSLPWIISIVLLVVLCFSAKGCSKKSDPPTAPAATQTQVPTLPCVDPHATTVIPEKPCNCPAAPPRNRQPKVVVLPEAPQPPAAPNPVPTVVQSTPPPPAAHAPGPRKYSIQELARIQEFLDSQKPIGSVAQTPMPVASASPEPPPAAMPAPTPKEERPGMICTVVNQHPCAKWRKATVKDWEKQFPEPTSYADLQLLRQANSQHSLVKIGVVNTVFNGVTAGSTLAGVVKNGNPTAIATSSSSSSASASASAAATSKLAAQQAGFGVAGQ